MNFFFKFEICHRFLAHFKRKFCKLSSMSAIFTPFFSQKSRTLLTNCGYSDLGKDTCSLPCPLRTCIYRMVYVYNQIQSVSFLHKIHAPRCKCFWIRNLIKPFFCFLHDCDCILRRLCLYLP